MPPSWPFTSQWRKNSNSQKIRFFNHQYFIKIMLITHIFFGSNYSWKKVHQSLHCMSTQKARCVLLWLSVAWSCGTYCRPNQLWSCMAFVWLCMASLLTWMAFMPKYRFNSFDLVFQSGSKVVKKLMNIAVNW